MHLEPSTSIPTGDYDLVIESFDLNSNASSPYTLEEDTIKVTVLHEGCEITPESVAALNESLKALPVKLEYPAKQDGFAVASFKTQYDKIISHLGYNEEMSVICGPFTKYIVA